MTEEDIELKVARAIFESEWEDDFPEGGALLAFELQKARAAIAAMREAGWREPSSERHAFP